VSGTATADEEGRFRVLIYTRTEGFHHDSILPAVQAISILGAQTGFAV
jgi:hypothetical protein